MKTIDPAIRYEIKAAQQADADSIPPAIWALLAIAFFAGMICGAAAALAV